MIFHYRFFHFNRGFKFLDSVCNGCHDMTIFCLNISDIIIITVKNVNYQCIIYNISKPEAIKKLFLKIVRIYKKYCLNLHSTQESLLFTFLFCYI